MIGSSLENDANTEGSRARLALPDARAPGHPLIPRFGARALAVFVALGLADAASGVEVPADPWPRQFKSGSATILVYQPQVESWVANTLTFRCAVAIVKPNPKDDDFGVIRARARTQVDRASRMVLLEDVVVTKRDFPTLPDNGLLYLISLKTQLGPAQRTIALDRLQASLEVSGSANFAGYPVHNEPPRIFVRESLAVLVSIDGPPALRPVADTNLLRVINTRALILAEREAGPLYLRLKDGWLVAGTIAGPWKKPAGLPEGLEAVARLVAASGVVDLPETDAPATDPPFDAAPPSIVVSISPAELIVFDGAAQFTPIAGTCLEQASNTASAVLLDAEDGRYFALLAGRWFSSPDLSGSWTFVSSQDLPADFQRIPADSPAGLVLAAVAGTPQAAEALTANSIPQTASVRRVLGPTFAPRFDGEPKFSEVAGTTLRYVVNSPMPIIQAAPTDYYALEAGVWFTAPALSGPWIVAASVPEAIYGIPLSSPLHPVTYVRIYGATIGLVYEGYTPGYLGTVATTDGVVVYGTGYVYAPWIGSAWYPPPATYRGAAGPAADPGAAALGLAADVATVNVYDSRGDAVASRVRSAYTTERGSTVAAGAGRRTIYTHPKTGKTSEYGWVEAGNDVYADKDGPIWSNASGSWQQRSRAGWSSAFGDTSWADRESQARALGEARFEGFHRKPNIPAAAPAP